VDYQDLLNKNIDELTKLSETVAKVSKFLDVLAEYHEDADSFDMMVAGISVNLYGVCLGAERLFTNIANDIDGYMPTGVQWQQKLFKQMGVELAGKRPRVIRSDTLSFLLELRAYKVSVLGGFGNNIDEQKVLAMALRLPDAYDGFKADCLMFHQELSQPLSQSLSVQPLRPCAPV